MIDHKKTFLNNCFQVLYENIITVYNDIAEFENTESMGQ